MKKAGVIINPLSGGGNAKGRALAETLRTADREAPVRVMLLERFEALIPALKEMVAEGLDALFISSGDGTIQAIQTWLAENLDEARLPRLVLLPHGSTNMTAADLGFHDRDARAQRDFILSRRWAQEDGLRTVSRPTLRLLNPRQGAPLHGMFLGGGAIARGTLFCQERFNRRGVRGNWLAPALTLAAAAGKALLGGPAAPEDESRLDRPVPMSIEADGQLIGDGLHTAVLATTLEKLVFGARPFLPGGPDRLKVGVFGHPPPSLIRWLPVVLWGRKEGRKLPASIRLLHADRLDIAGDAPFILDGERVLPPADAPLRVEVGPRFTYIRG